MLCTADFDNYLRALARTCGNTKLLITYCLLADENQGRCYEDRMLSKGLRVHSRDYQPRVRLASALPRSDSP
jgi:hypothetical protein